MAPAAPAPTTQPELLMGETFAPQPEALRKGMAPQDPLSGGMLELGAHGRAGRERLEGESG